jgi:DNA sulfur modification protein DndD
MKIERITLENFRQYYGCQRLSFARDTERNVTIIHGVNGAGKTSLFLALNWCLYGRGEGNVKIIDNVGKLISKEAVSHAAEGDFVKTSVELTFIHDGEKYLVKRTLEGAKKKGEVVEAENIDEFTMMRTRADGQAERVRNPIGTINAILPANVREYFLFDGEKIDNFAKPEASSQVKEAIYLVLKLEILERGRRHLEDVADEFRRDLKKVSGAELRKLIEQEEDARVENKKANKRIEELQNEISSARQKVKDINQRLRELENTREIQERRDRVEQDLKQRKSELETTTTQIKNIATEAYYVIAQPLIDKALGLLDEKRQRGEIPSSIRQQFVEDLIERKICVCGRSFEEQGEEHKRLLHLLKNSYPGSLEDDVLDTSANLRSFSEIQKTQLKTLSSNMTRRAQLLDYISGLQDELDDIGRQLKGSSTEEISKLEIKRQEYQADIDSFNMEIGATKTQIEDLDAKIAELGKEISNAQKAEVKGRVVSRKLELAQQAADAISNMYQTFANEMRIKIEAKTKEIFKNLIWKESHFQDILLDTEYNLEVIDRYGLPARPELSAGERQVLSLSFITAMSRVSEEEAPLIMDTPFGRLSSQHRNSITEQLPLMADQLVLFVTDEELRDQARKNLEPKIGLEYRLVFDPETSCTEIREI